MSRAPHSVTTPAEVVGSSEPTTSEIAKLVVVSMDQMIRNMMGPIVSVEVAAIMCAGPTALTVAPQRR
jgi:hypothetical protein